MCCILRNEICTINIIQLRKGVIFMKTNLKFINFNKGNGSVATVTKDLTRYLYETIVPELEEKLESFIDEVSISVTKTTVGIKILLISKYNGKNIVVEEIGKDFYHIVPKATKVFIKTALKYKNKSVAKKRSRFMESKEELKELIIESNEETSIENTPLVVQKVKKFAIKPMYIEEAILQMEMLGHNFFLFVDDETKQYCVVYKRKNGSYGLIESMIE